MLRVRGVCHGVSGGRNCNGKQAGFSCPAKDGEGIGKGIEGIGTWFLGLLGRGNGVPPVGSLEVDISAVATPDHSPRGTHRRCIATGAAPIAILLVYLGWS